MAATEVVWGFTEARRAGVNQDPTQGEFFAPEEGLAGALVRESVQNSLDAHDKANGQPVRLRFHFGQASAYTYVTAPYLAGLDQHLVAQNLSTIPASSEGLKYLVIEDFGTRGLQGDPSHSIFDEQSTGTGQRNDFFYFWRNVGRSRKEQTERTSVRLT